MKTFASLKIRNYKLYFWGQAISLCGTWMQTIGQDWLVLQLTKSGTQLGIVSAFQFLPLLFLAPYGGLIADRFSKRKILLLTQSIAAILALILGLLVITGGIKIWMIYILAMCLGLVNSVDNPTRQTFASEMVDKAHLSNAIALNSTEVNLARAIGPVIGGVVIAMVGLGPCFLINSASYIAVIIMLAMMRHRELYLTEAVAKAKGQIREGIKYILSYPLLFHTIMMMVIIGTLSYEFSVSLPLLAQFTFHGNAQSYSYLVAATGLGSVIGGYFAIKRRVVAPHLLIFSALGFGTALTLAAFMPTLPLAVLMLFFAGMFSLNFISLGNTILQMESAPEMRGRVMSFWTVAFLGSTPIGGPIIGWVGEKFGARWGLGVGGIAAIFAAIYGALIVLKKTIKARSVSEDIRIRDEENEAAENTRI
jgi:MFS family permease